MLGTEQLSNWREKERDEHCREADALLMKDSRREIQAILVWDWKEI